MDIILFRLVLTQRENHLIKPIAARKGHANKAKAEVQQICKEFRLPEDQQFESGQILTVSDLEKCLNGWRCFNH